MTLIYRKIIQYTFSNDYNIEIPTAVLQCQRPVSSHAKPDDQYKQIHHKQFSVFNIQFLKFDHLLSGMTQSFHR